MKEKGLRILSLLSLFIFTIISPLSVAGQEDLAKFQLDLSIVLNSQAYPQKQYKFDIIERGPNQEVLEEAEVYTYDPQSPNHLENIELKPGVYTFRLYDGSQTPFVREGMPISIAKSQQTNQDGTEFIDTLNEGSLNDWGNGTVVYDVNFQVFPDQENIKLLLVFSDGSPIEEIEQTNQTDQTDEADEADEDPESLENSGNSLVDDGTEEMGGTEPIQVPFRVTDQDGLAVDGVEIILNEETGLTGPDGQVVIEMEPGLADIEISQVPEGYEGVASYDPVEIDGPLLEPIALSVFKQAALTATGSSKIMMIDQDQKPLAGVSLLVNDQEFVSDDQGQILLENLAEGAYPYTVVTVPDGYQTPQADNISIQADQVTEITISLEAIQIPGQVVITVTDQNNQPVGQAQIILNDQTFVTNDQGQAIILELLPDQYTYELGELPEGYSGQATGQITVGAGQEAQASIKVEKDLEPGQVMVSVYDQTDQAVVGAVIGLGDLEQVTNDQGMVSFDQIVPNSYPLTIKDLPAGYTHHLVEALDIVVDEGISLEKVLKVERDLPARQLTIQAIDQNGQAVAQAKIRVGDQEVTTDDKGLADIEEIKPGTYEISATELPEGYLSGKAGQVIIPETEDASLTVTFEKEIKPASAQITFTDQNQNPVAGVEFQFGGHSASSDSNGHIYFNQLTPGNYNYDITGLPQGYANEPIADRASLEEEEVFKLDIEIEKLPEQGEVKVIVNDDAGKAVAGAKVKLSGMEVRTDKEGQAIFKPIDVGQVQVDLIDIPEGYQANLSRQTGQVKKDQMTDLVLSVKKIEETTTTTTESTTTTQATTESTTTTEATTESQTETTSTEVSSTEAPSTTQADKPIKDLVLTPQEEKDLDKQAKEATRQFVDPETGIEIWVNPQDAGQIIKLKVEKVDSSILAGYEADIYKLTLIDKYNRDVSLTRVAEVKLPTKPVNSQIKVLRMDDSQLSSMIFALHNNRVTFRTQQLGTFAITYGNKKVAQAETTTTTQAPTNIQVTKTKSVEEKDDLPKTGEAGGKLLVVLGIALVGGGLFFLFKGRKNH